MRYFKLLLASFFLVFGFFAVSAAAPFAASADVSAEDVLRDFRATIDGYGDFEVPFSVRSSYADAVFGSGEFAGKLTVSGSRFVVTSSQLEVYYDGATLWVYDPARNEVNVESLDARQGNVLMNPSKLLNFKVSDFACSMPEPGVLVLVPVVAGQGYKYLKVYYSILSPSRTSVTTHLSGSDPVSASSAASRVTVSRIDVCGIGSSSSSSSQNVTFKLGTIVSIRATDKTFRFDVKSHPKVDVVDFRR